MTYIEVNFFVFLFISFLVFYACPKKHRWLVLLASSIVFYCFAGLNFLSFILFTSFTIYLAGLKMGKVYIKLDEDLKEEGIDRKAKKELKEKAKNTCKKFMLAALLVNVGLLIFIKFTKFAINPINDILDMLGSDATFSAKHIIVPLGVSYYTFSCLSYLLDLYWKRVEYEKNYFRFLLYAIYFPHILQGPIERYGKLGKRLKEELVFDYDRICRGLQLMLWGFFKKLVVADRVNIFNNGVYASGSKAEGLIYVIAFFLDVVYIYADFSGCMDIARGASEIFGVEMDLNFDYPFGSKTIPEFWRRWHMSLGGWFKDYVYYPISTSKFTKNLTRKCKDAKLPEALTRSLVTILPVFVTWVSTGIWHGTGINYVCWGLYYATMIFLSVTFGDMMRNLGQKLHIKTDTWSFEFFQMFRTTCIFAGGRILTRPGSLALTKQAIISAFTEFNPWIFTDGSLYKYGLNQKNFRLMVIAVIIFCVINIFQKRQPIREWISKQNIVFRWIVYFVAVFSIIIFGIYGSEYDAASFVYMAY